MFKPRDYRVFLFSLLAFILSCQYSLIPGWASTEELEEREEQKSPCGEMADTCPDAEIIEIRIVHDPIFQPRDNLPSWFPRQTANRLHIDTAEAVIRRELLFKEGDTLDPEQIAETLRNLRAQGYFRD